MIKKSGLYSRIGLVLLLALTFMGIGKIEGKEPAMSKSFYDFTVKDNRGESFDLSTLKGKVVLVVNTASRCGFTSQYEGLQELYQKYQDRGLEILAFPCNQFGSQEPGTAEQIAQFCQVNYEIRFPLMAKVDVNGPEAEPLYVFLKNEKPGLLGSKDIKWNFTKFLIDQNGKVLKRYAPQNTPQSIAKDIEPLL